MPAAVHEHHVVEQRAVAVGRRPQLLQEVREHLHVQRVDLGELLQRVGTLLMMRQRMVRLGHADFRIGAACSARVRP